MVYRANLRALEIYKSEDRALGDEPVFAEDDIPQSRLDLMADPSPSPEQTLIQKDLADKLKRIGEWLLKEEGIDPQKIKIVFRRYFNTAEYPVSYTEASKDFKTKKNKAPTVEWGRQLSRAGLARLRQFLLEEGLAEDFGWVMTEWEKECLKQGKRPDKSSGR